MTPHANESLPAPLLQLSNLTVALPDGGVIIDDISFEVARGECLAIVGASGAGKSVLARTLLGLAQQQRKWSVRSERFLLSGHDLRRAHARQWRSVRGSTVGLVLQDALQSLDPLRTIGAEVAETLAIRGVPKAARRAAVISALTAAGLPDAEHRLGQRSGELSGGMRQRVLIASAMVADPELLVADEPTTALDSTTADRVLRLLSEARDRGTSLVLVSHDLSAVARVADRVAVLHRGRIVEIGAADQVLTAPRQPVTRQLVNAIPHGPRPPRNVAAMGVAPLPDQTRELLKLHGVSHQFNAPTGGSTGLHDTDLTLRAGEAVGIVGESGAGKTTLARIIAGAERTDSGSIERAAGGCRVRLIPQDPLASFDPRWRVGRILAASLREDTAAPPTVESLLKLVNLDAGFAARRPATLSGGQRQRVAIARALAADPDLLVCDEPVSALDMSTQAGILELIRDLQERRGLAIVFVSHDLAAVRTVCDRVLIMREGRVVEQGPTEQVFGDPQHSFTRALVASATA